jgi:hypothetical protein
MAWTRLVGAAVMAMVAALALIQLGTMSCSTGPTTLDAGFLSERAATFDASPE